MEAQAYSMRMNKANDGERYYVMDDPHIWIELSDEMRDKLNKLNKGLL